MAITKYESAWEDLTSIENEVGGGNSVEWDIFVHSDDPVNDTEATVRQYIKANLPTTYQGLARSEIAVKEQATRDHGVAIWKCTLTYTDPSTVSVPVLKPNDPMRISVRSSGNQTLKSKFSLQLVEETAADGWVLDNTKLELAVGIKYDASAETPLTVEGVDIPYGTVEIGVEQAVWQSAIDGGYLIRLADAANANYVNNDIWQGFAIGTMRYISFDSQENPGLDPASKYWTLNHTFIFERTVSAAELNQSLAILNPSLDPFTQNKLGHWWVETTLGAETVILASTPEKIERTVTTVKRAAIHKIYPETAFNALFTP